MKSSSGLYFRKLDQVRAVAIFLVFFWHFIGHAEITPLPGTFSFLPNALLAQGHTGVAIFMVLSGYLFAKLTTGKQLDYAPFLLNRALRLAPLLLLAITFHALYFSLTHRAATLPQYFYDVAASVVLPTLPNGGWSITTEVHFYLIFPLILYMERKLPLSSLLIVAAAIAVRCAVGYFLGVEKIVDAAYWTIIGRIDQFIVGIIFARYAFLTRPSPFGAALVLLAWLNAWFAFAKMGGFYGTSHSTIWIILPTAEAVSYGYLISWFDKFGAESNSVAATALQNVGKWSYSIYVLHFLLVSKLWILINTHIMLVTNFYAAVLWAIPSFAIVAILGAITFNYFEKFFLRFRAPYLQSRASERS